MERADASRVIVAGIILLIALYLVFAFFTGENQNPKYITRFNVTKSFTKNEFEVNFSLANEKKEYVTANGTATLRIVNSNGEEVYNKAFPVTKDDFRDYVLTLNDTQIKAFYMTIPSTGIKKGSSTTGTAYLSLSLGNESFPSFEIDTGVFGLEI